MNARVLDYLDELLALYPAQGMFGNKRKCARHIAKHIPADAQTFADPFGGSGVVSYAAKLLGLEVRSNDIMGFAALRLRAQVLNDGVSLTNADIDMLVSPNPDKQDYCERWYGRAIGVGNARFLDALAANLSKLDCDIRRDVAIYIAILLVLKRMTFCAVKFSPLKTLSGRRNLRGFDLQAEFRRYATEQFPLLVFSNEKQHRATRMDALALVDGIEADVLYVDSPYCSPGGRYESDLAFYDKLVLILQGHPEHVGNPYSGVANLPAHTDFSKRKSALLGFAKLFMRARGCRRIICSYNLTSKISPFEIIALAQRHYGKLVAWDEVATNHTPTERDAIMKSGEVILVFERYADKPDGEPVAFELPTPIRFIDLFAGGIGAFHIAGKRVGAQCVFACELMRQARKFYEANHGLKPAGDITKIDPSEIPAYEILCAGWPCQPWSAAGHELGFTDPRGSLFLEIIRLAKAHRPLVLFLENIDNLARKKNARALQVICEEIEAAGYDVHKKVLNSSHFRCGSARRRIYFACFRKDLGVTRFDFPQPTCELSSIKDYLLPDSETTKYLIGTDELAALRWVKPKPLPCPLGKGDRCPHGTGDNCPLRTVKIGTVGKGHQGDRVYDGSHLTTTITTGFNPDAHLINGVIRRLAPRELANAMGLPSDFVLPKNEHTAKKFIGNSMAVPVVEKIFAKIIETLQAKANLAVNKAA